MEQNLESLVNWLTKSEEKPVEERSENADVLQSLIIPARSGSLVENKPLQQTANHHTLQQDTARNQSQPIPFDTPSLNFSPSTPNNRKRERDATTMSLDVLPPSSQDFTIEGLVSIGEWEAECQAQYTQQQQQRQQQQSFKLSGTDQPTKLPSKKPNGESIARLNNLCQLNNLRPDYEFTEVVKQQFSAKLSLLLGGTSIVSLTSAEGKFFPSKKEAKEAIAEAGLAWLSSRPNLRTNAKQPVPGTQAPQPNAADAVDKSENWMGILVEYCQAARLAMPVFEEFSFQNGGFPRFACTCTLPVQPREPFGSTQDFFTNKKAAKTNAARDAVLWLRHEGHLSNKKAKTSIAVSAHGSTTTTTTTTTTTSPAIAPTNSESPADSTGSSGEENGSPPHRVTALCAELGIDPPQYIWFPDPRIPGLVSGHARFSGVAPPSLQGEVGAVVNVVGKKKAREACARNVAQVLEEIKAERMSSLQLGMGSA